MMLNIDHIVTGAMLVIGAYIVFFVGKIIHSLFHREYNLTEELVARDNPAVALSLVGYYAGLVLCIGGALTGPSNGMMEDMIDLGLYGFLSIFLLNASWFLCDRLILYKFKVSEELLRDHNQGTGVVSFGISIASGLVIYGSVSGEGGNIWTAVIFWALGQLILILAGLLYSWIVPFDIHEEIEKDNVAAGVSFAGALIAMGLVIGLSAEGDFSSFREDLPTYVAFSLLGLIMLPLIRFLTDKVLLPTVRLTDEIIAGTADQEKPNVGAAYIEAFSYIAAAFIIFWCV